MRSLLGLTVLLGILTVTIMIGGNFGTGYTAGSDEHSTSSASLRRGLEAFIPVSRSQDRIFALPENLSRSSLKAPVRRFAIPELELEARAAYAAEVQTHTVLLEKSARMPFPVASLTKLATALTALDLIPHDSEILVSKEAVAQDGTAGDLMPGERLSRNDLLAAMLIPSSNDAAWALAEYIGVPVFVEAMNRKIEGLGLNGTIEFLNPHGLDTGGHRASAVDVATLLAAALEKPILEELLRMKEYRIKDGNGRTIHYFKNTNELLWFVPGIIGAKTGFTDEAKGTLAVAFEPLRVNSAEPLVVNEVELYRVSDSAGDDTQESYIVILVVLGSQDRFSDTEALIRWIREAYNWE